MYFLFDVINALGSVYRVVCLSLSFPGSFFICFVFVFAFTFFFSESSKKKIKDISIQSFYYLLSTRNNSFLVFSFYFYTYKKKKRTSLLIKQRIQFTKRHVDQKMANISFRNILYEISQLQRFSFWSFVKLS